jgi:hypothetical protein
MSFRVENFFDGMHGESHKNKRSKGTVHKVVVGADA